MSLILNIDTALESGTVSLSQKGELLLFRENVNQKDHAAWMHGAIHEMIRDSGFTINHLQAVAVSIGPGSYTGLRIGLSAAKGLCFALQIPLITIGTLEIMAAAAIQRAPGDLINETGLLCPMIDARRMEVFFALYDHQLALISKPKAVIVDEEIFRGILTDKKILFFGNGSYKLKNNLLHPHAFFTDLSPQAADMTPLSYQYYKQTRFADLAYVEPLYIKDFYTVSPKRG